MLTQQQSSQKKIIFILLLIAALIYSLISLWTYPQVDDLMFIYRYLVNNDYSQDFTWKGIIDGALLTREIDNSRLCNFLAVFSTLFSPTKEIFPFLNGAVVALMIYFTTRIWGMKNNWVATAVAWFLILILLPWRNALFTHDYALNYPFSAVINIIFFYCILKFEDTRKFSFWFFPALLFAIIAGAWSESFTASACFGLYSYALILLFDKSKQKPSPQFWVLLLTYTAIGLLITFSPGVMNRADSEFSNSSYYPLYKRIIYQAPSFIGFVVIILSCFTGKIRKAFNNPYFIILMGTAVFSTLLSLTVQPQSRTAFWPAYCTIIYLGILYRENIIRWFGKRWMKALGATLLIFCIANGIYNAEAQYRLYKVNQKIESELKKSPSGTAFVDILFPYDFPIYSLYLMSKGAWIQNFHIDYYELVNQKKLLAVVPTSLKTPENGKECVSRDGRFFRTGNAIWTAIPNEKLQNYDEDNFSLILNNGKHVRYVLAQLREFTALDGKKYSYIYFENYDSRDIKEVIYRGDF